MPVTNAPPDFRDDGLGVPYINSWSYKPRPAFRGLGPLYFGLELEVSFSGYDMLYGTRAATWFLREAGDRSSGPLGYLKHDGSVNGFEIVTHPMSYPWLMRDFPWAMLPSLASYNGYIDSGTNGLHVHVSRDGFTGASHQYRWMKLLYRNAAQVEAVAGRQTQWGSFARQGQVSQFWHLKNQVKRAKGGYPSDEEDYLERAGQSHYAAINNIPADTFEVRVFAATLNPVVLKYRVQLVAASVDYARGLKASDITRDRAWDWDRFASWVQDQRDGSRRQRYPELAAFLAGRALQIRAARAEAEARRARRRAMREEEAFADVDYAERG